MGLGMNMRTVRGHALLVRSRKVAPAPDAAGKVVRAQDRERDSASTALKELDRQVPSPPLVESRGEKQAQLSDVSPTKKNISPQRRRPRNYDVVKEVALAQASISNSRRKIESVLADFYVPQRAVVMGNLVAVVGEYFVASEQSFEICLREHSGPPEKGSMLDEEEEEDFLVDDDDEESLGSAFSVLLDDDIFDASRDRVHHFMWRKDVLRPSTACGAGMCMPFGVTRVSTQVEL